MKTGHESYKPGYYAELFEIEEHNFWFRSRNRLIVWALGNYFPDIKNFLEIGCGTGFVLSGIREAFPHVALCGGDIYPEGLSYARKRIEDARLLQMDSRNVPFRNEFDAVGAFDLIEHVAEDEAVLSEMYQATHEGGGIILTAPQHGFLWSRFDEEACHVRRYEVSELKAKVENSGFKVISVISFISLLFPLVALSRLLKRSPNKEYNIMNEFKLGRLTNTILEKVTGLERGLIRLGMRFPFGGSVLIVAKKAKRDK